MHQGFTSKIPGVEPRNSRVAKPSTLPPLSHSHGPLFKMLVYKVAKAGLELVASGGLGVTGLYHHQAWLPVIVITVTV